MEQNKNDRCCISSDQFSCYQFLIKVNFKNEWRFHLVSKHEKKRWKHEAAGREVLLFQF